MEPALHHTAGPLQNLSDAEQLGQPTLQKAALSYALEKKIDNHNFWLALSGKKALHDPTAVLTLAFIILLLKYELLFTVQA